MSNQIVKPSRENSAKMLLTNTMAASVNPNINSELSSTDEETEVDENTKAFLTYVRQAAYGPEDEVDLIMKDHAYARPWNWRPEHIYVRPAKKIFYSNYKRDPLNSEEFIDVEKEDSEPEGPTLDLFKARQAMDELHRVTSFVRPEDTDDWEEKIDKILWSPVQNRIFNRIVKLLNTEHISRLSQSNSKYEPIRRRTLIDKTAKKFRETMASANWDWRITQWLHSLLFDHLPQNYLAIYLDLLQTLRQKIPQLVDKMIAIQPNINSKGSTITWETLGPLLKKSWDPLPPAVTTNKTKKLPGNPILIVVPNGLPTNVSSRHHKWITQLGALGMVVTVNPHLGLTISRMTVIAGIEQLVQVTRAKIQDVKADYPGRPIILVGFSTGAALACQVSLMEHVTAIVCLGFPMNTVDGKRGNPDDCLLDVRCPVMFVVGQNSILARVENVEDMRKDMIVPTRLLLVGSADDHLRISTSKKIVKHINQSIVDRAILDEIGDFIGGILLQSHSLPLRSPNSINNYDNKHKRPGADGKKRKTSTSSSVDSEPQSPCLKKMKTQSPQHVSTNNGQRIPINTHVLPRGTLVTLTGTTATQTPRRKSRGSLNNQNYPDQLITSRLTPQQKNMENSTGGITLNIGSFASLAPVGPIRFEPTSINLQSTAASKNCVNALKTSNTFIKVSKSNQVNIGTQQQNVAKIKMIMPTKKPGQRTYKNPNVPEKTGEINIVNVVSSASSSIRVSAPTATVTNMKTTPRTTNVPALPSFQVTKSTAGTVIPGKPVTPANVVLTTKNLPLTTTTATASAPKALPAAPTKVADISMTSGIKKQPIRSITTNQLNQVSKCSVIGIGTTVTKERPQTSLTPKISFQKLPWPQTKVETAKSTAKNGAESTEMPRITSNSLDDDLGNILDIPIIIAKEGETLNNLERLSPLPQTANPVTMQSSEVKSLPVINAVGNKVVFINKNLTSTTEGISSTNTVSLSRSTLTTSQPTIKYTKIILTKKPEHEESQKGNHVILTKTGRRPNNFVVLDPKNEVKYAQTVMRIPANTLGEMQINENAVSPAHNSNVLRTKQNYIGLNAKNGGKS